jgi:endonuclease I
MKLMAKSAQELLVVLEETRETLFKDRKTAYPYTEWEHKRAQVKQRLHRLPEYIREAVF